MIEKIKQTVAFISGMLKFHRACFTSSLKIKQLH